MKAIMILAISALLGACAVGPDYRAPVSPLADEWIEEQSEALDSSAPLSDWWRAFDDPLLEHYVAAALEANHDVRIARARLREVRAMRAQSRSRLLPQLNTVLRYTSYTLSENSPTSDSQAIQAGLIDRSDDFYESLFDASWELDVFGGNRRRVEAATARIQASDAQVSATELSIVAEVARAVLELRSLQQRLIVARENIELQSQTLELVTRRMRSGLAPELDVLRAQAQLEATRSFIPELEGEVRAGVHRIAVLSATPLEEALADLEPPQPIPNHTETLALGVRSDVLRRRPDVRAAERELAAATADIGVAKGELFPKFVLTGQLGFESGMLSNLGDGTSRKSGLVPFIHWPLFSGGRLRAQMEAADARQEIQLAAYEKAVLSAIEEAETALARYSRSERSREHAALAADASAQSAEIARSLYGSGLSGFLEVLDADRRRLEAEDNLLLREAEVAVTLVATYKALGAY